MQVQVLSPSTNQPIFSVSELNQLARTTLERSVGQIWISGEISNLSQPSSGHCYFSLKDQRAQVRCALFRSSMQKLKFQLENGQHVLVFAQVSLYEPRGDFQIIASRIELAGDGALQLAFEQLKKRLAAEGLFDERHKKGLPHFASRIGVITSATGAAIRDILTVLKRRFASIPVIIYPSLVQGEQAAAQLVRALQIANQRQECDVLILARGGGSLEDLWPFNEEIVARAIFASQIPIISGVGHESDITIADFVADLRAATPSAAAEHASPNKQEYQKHLHQLQQRLTQLIATELRHAQLRLKHLGQRLQHPGQRLQQQMQQLDQLEQRLLLAQRYFIKQCHSGLSQLSLKLTHLNPQVSISKIEVLLHTLLQRLKLSMQHRLTQRQQQLQHLAHTLQAVSPLTTLQRGYAIAQQAQTGILIRDSHDVNIGEHIQVRLANGQLSCIVADKS